MGINRVAFSGRIETLDALRVSPVGVPSVRLDVVHESTQTEAGHPRKIECRMRVVVVGQQARTVAALTAGTEVEIAGFLARASLKSEWPVLHATEINVI